MKRFYKQPLCVSVMVNAQSVLMVSGGGGGGDDTKTKLGIGTGCVTKGA